MFSSKALVSDVVNRAYDLSVDTETWFIRAVGLLRSTLDDGLGVFSAILDPQAGQLVQEHLDGADPLNLALTREGVVQRTYDQFPKEHTAVTMSEVVGVPRVEAFLQEAEGRIGPFPSSFRARDCCGLVGLDSVGMMIWVCSPRAVAGRATRTERRLAGLIMPHLAAGLRLRRVLGSGGSALDAPAAEAVFDENARCLNAQGMADAPQAREVLRSAVLDAVRSGAGAGIEKPREELLAGRWSLVDRFDRQGRRYLVAYRNPRGVADPRRLSASEREVAMRLALGMSQKVVAIELGVQPSTVAGLASSATKKLGLRSTWELPLFWRDTDGRPVALDADLIAVESRDPWDRDEQLTSAERDVLRGVVRGYSNAEIANRRGSSERTVANQIASVFAKLGVFSRLELAALVTGMDGETVPA